MEDVQIWIMGLVLVVLALLFIAQQATSIIGDRQRAEQWQKQYENVRDMLTVEQVERFAQALRDRDANDTGIDDIAARVVERLGPMLLQKDQSPQGDFAETGQGDE